MLNDSTRKTIFNAKWLFKVIHGHLFDVDEKPFWDDILRCNNLGITYELWKDIATEEAKMAIFDHLTLI